MTTFLCILSLIAIGAIAGSMVSRQYYGVSLLANVLIGIAGSLAASRLGELVGLGRGFAAFSLWGVLLGCAGACLLPLGYCRIWKKITAK